MIPDTKMHDDRILGLEQSIHDLRGQEALFLKAQGMDEQATKAFQDAEKIKADLDTAKSDLKAKLTARAEALSKTAEAMARAMGDILPGGKGVFDIDPDGKVLIGWTRCGVTTPYAGLSGGQKVIFDAALAHAMRAEIIIIEAAEMDDQAMARAFKHIVEKNPTAQIIVNTCHEVDAVEGFDVVLIGGAA